jgi:hypothetical protein
MSDWRIILIVSAAPIISAFGAIWMKAGIDRRDRKSERRAAAYERLAAASEIMAMRSAAYNTMRGPRHAAGAALNNVTKFVMVMLLSILRPLRKDPQTLQMLVDSLPTPVEPEEIMTGSELLNAMDELIRARVEVHLVGSEEAIDAADVLLDRSREFLEATEKHQMSFRGWSAKPGGGPERENMLDAHRKFVNVTRRR